MISSKCGEVTWAPVTKKLWNSSLKKMTDFTSLRWSLSHDYNYQMNDNDIADQLRLVYWIMRFQRNNKWWWALFLWGYEVSMVNSYVSMKRYCELKGVSVPWSHPDWNEAIGYAHLDPIEYWPRRKGLPAKNDDTTGLAKQASMSDLSKKAPRLDSMSLLPTRGRLMVRLDTTLPHMPLRLTNVNTTCQLHCWAWKETHPKDKQEGNNIKPQGSGAHVMTCETCKVHLCLGCWEIYHRSHSLKRWFFDILGNYEEAGLDPAHKRRKK